MLTARHLVIGLVIACVALPGCAGCGQQAAKPVAVHPPALVPPPPPEMLDSDRHRKEAIDAALAFAKAKYPAKLELDHPRAEFLGGHAMATPGANPGKLIAKDAPVGTWRIYLKVIKAAAVSTVKAGPEAATTAAGSATPEDDVAIGTRGFYVRPDLTVVETQGLPSFSAGAPSAEQGTMPALKTGP